jgi:hypothetical protein
MTCASASRRSPFRAAGSKWRAPTVATRSTAKGPAARLRPTGQGDTVQVLWWRREAWAAPGDFGPIIMPLNQALEFIASEGFFWIHA